MALALSGEATEVATRRRLLFLDHCFEAIVDFVLTTSLGKDNRNVGSASSLVTQYIRGVSQRRKSLYQVFG